MLCSAERPLYESGFQATAIGMVGLWIVWLAIGWALSGAVAATKTLRRCGKRLLAFGVVTICGVAVFCGSLVCVASWVMSFQTGRFAGWDLVQFALSYDLDDLWSCMGPGEQGSAIVLALAAPVVIAALSRGIWWLGRHNSKAMNRWVSPAGLTLTCIICLCYWLNGLSVDTSETRVARTTQAVSSHAGPGVTMVVSCYREMRQEPIAPVIADEELVPLRAAASAVESSSAPATGTSPPRSVIVVAFESLRSDVVGCVHQGREVTPNLNRLANGGHVFAKSYAQSSHSDYADVCLMSSLYPLRTRHHHFYRSDDPWPKRLAFDHYSDAGYKTAIISSQNEAWGGMEEFLDTPSLDVFYHADRSPELSHVASRDPGFAKEIEEGVYSAGQLPDDLTMDRAIAWVKSCHKNDERCFLSMNLQSSHFPYWTPLQNRGGSSGPFQPSHLDADVTFLSHPPEKTDTVRNAFYNGLHFADRQLGRLVSELTAIGILDETLLVVVGENGEAFHEGETLSGHSVVGHAGAAVEQAIHVATVMHCPALLAPAIDDRPFEAVDLVPTLAGLCGLPQSPLWQGVNAFDDSNVPADERLLFFHVNTSIAREDGVLLGGRWKYRLEPETGMAKLFDVLSDPNERHDIAQQRPDIFGQLEFAHEQWRTRQLAYYHFPHYYRSFCPPQPPRRVEISIETSRWDVADGGSDLAE